MCRPTVNVVLAIDVLLLTCSGAWALKFAGETGNLGINFDEKLARSRPFRQPELQPRLVGLDGSVRDF